MTWLLWILGIVLLLLLLLCLLRVGVLIRYEETLNVRVTAGLVRIQVFPAKPGKEKKPKKEKKSGKGTSGEDPADGGSSESGKSGEAKKKVFPKPDLEDIRSAVSALWPPLKKALGRTRRGIRIDPLEAAVCLGGRNDPAATAELYGYLNAAMWSGMPVLERLLRIPDPALRLEMDFDREETRARVLTGVSIRVGTILAVALQVGIPAVKWYLKFSKKHKQAAEDPAHTPTAEQKPAA